MNKVKIVLLVLLSSALVLLVVQNTALTPAHFLWLTFDAPVIVLLFLAAVGGFMAGLLAAHFLHKQRAGTTAKAAA